MNIVHYNVFSCFEQLSSQLAQVEKQVQNIEKALAEPLPVAQYNQLFLDLEKAIQPLKKLKEDAHFLRDFGQELLERLGEIEKKSPILFGDIFTRSLDVQVLKIREEAENIKNSLTSGKLDSLASRVHSLRENISTLCHDYKLGENTQVISAIEEFIERVEKFINEHGPSFADQPGSAHELQRIAAQASFKKEVMDAPSAELLMELFEVAELFEQGQLPGAKRRMDKLPPHLLRRIEHYKQRVEEVVQNGSSDHFYAPALYAASLELSRGGRPVAIEEELSSFYKGLEEISGKEATEKEPFSDRSYESWGA